MQQNRTTNINFIYKISHQIQHSRFFILQNNFLLFSYSPILIDQVSLRPTMFVFAPNRKQALELSICHCCRWFVVGFRRSWDARSRCCCCTARWWRREWRRVWLSKVVERFHRVLSVAPLLASNTLLFKIIRKPWVASLLLGLGLVFLWIFLFLFPLSNKLCELWVSC